MTLWLGFGHFDFVSRKKLIMDTEDGILHPYADDVIIVAESDAYLAGLLIVLITFCLRSYD